MPKVIDICPMCKKEFSNCTDGAFVKMFCSVGCEVDAGDPEEGISKMISSAEIDVGNAIRHYGMKSVLEAMILYLGYENDYEINLKVDLREALEKYEKRYEGE